MVALGLPSVWTYYTAPRSARKRVGDMKQQRLLQAVLGVNDLGPHDNALHYSVAVNTDCGM